MFSCLFPIAALALGALAQNSSFAHSATRTTTSSSDDEAAQTTISILWSADLSGEFYSDMTSGFSVINADACATTLATAASFGGESATTYTIVASSGGYEEIFSAAVNNSTEAGSISCTTMDASKLKCAGTYSLSYNGTNIAQTYTNTNSYNSSLAMTGYAVTEGAFKLASATGSCTKHGNAAAPTGVIQDVYKVIIVPAAAVVAAALI